MFGRGFLNFEGNKKSVRRGNPRKGKEKPMYRTVLRRAAALALAAAVLCPYSAAKAEGGTVTTENHIGTGSVSISLNEYRLGPDGKEVPIEGNSDRRTVMPGDTVSKISTITVNGHKSWIRAKVMTEGDQRITQLSPSWVTLCDESGWVKKGDYWYYTKPVDHGSTIRFTKEVRIPPEADASNAEFHVVIWADAVQYDNFRPDFKKEDPWFGTLIEESAYQTYRPGSAKDMHYFVRYEGGAQGLIANSQDLFSNFQSLMPGDTVSDSLAIGNAYAKPVRLFFRIEGETDNALAKQVKLKIRAGEIQIFHGTLSDAMKEIYLAYMTPNWSSVLTYELEVPAELKNAFALQDCGQKWIFRAEVNPVKNLIPNTADPDDLKFYAAGFAVSLLAAAIAFTHLRRDRGAL